MELNSLTQEELQQLKIDFIIYMCHLASTQLNLLQRGLRLNATPDYNVKRADSTGKPRKLSTLTKDTLECDVNDAEDSRNLPSKKILDEIKIQRELDMLLNFYALMYEELSHAAATTSYAKLIATVEALQEKSNKEVVIKNELCESQAELKSLKAQIESDGEVAQARMATQDDRIGTLRHNLRYVRRVNDLEYSLVIRWEHNRVNQAIIVCENEERTLQQQIDELERRLNGEQRIICEVENFNGKQFDELQAQIIDWQRKYEIEMAKMHVRTQEKEKRIRDLHKMHERHRQTYKEHVEFVRDYLAEKAEEKRLFELEMHRIESAVRIQAWWRGVMVRHGLGPYKKKKAKKGKKGKAKGN